MNTGIMRIEEISRTKTCSGPDILDLLVQIRKVIETDNSQAQYAHLYLYCTWCVHSVVEKSYLAHTFLKELTNTLVKYKSSDPQNIIDHVSEGLGLQIFKQELELFLKEKNISSHFTQPANWQIFLSATINFCIDSPIKLYESNKHRKSRKLLSEILSKEHGEIYAVMEFKFTIPETIATKDGYIINSKQQIYWEMTIGQGRKIFGPLHYIHDSNL